jgi:hypothetical protein
MVHKDGRLFVFDGYESSQEVIITQTLEERFARKFLVKTDVKNLFPSIYSHSIGWALAGKSVAKAARDSKILYFNQLDAAFRNCRRNETNGVLIGPGTSNVAAEIVLGAVDRSLEGKYQHFLRFVDDYSFFAKDRNEADAFLRDLSHELAVYELILNEAKTEIVELPVPLQPDWKTSLTLLQPVNGDSDGKVLSFIDLAVSLSSNRIDSSVLVHAFLHTHEQPL